MVDAALGEALALRARHAIDELAAFAANRERTARQRAIALLAVAVALALADDPTRAPPSAALDALDDPELIDAALSAGLAAAVVGVLHTAPRDPATRATRRLIGRRLVAAGESGLHVVELLVAADELARAAALAATELARVLAADDPLARAVLVRWLVGRGASDALVVSVLDVLQRRELDLLAREASKIPCDQPAAVAELHKAIARRINP